MTRLLSAGTVPLIISAVLIVVAATLAIETGRRRVKALRASRRRITWFAADTAMATRADQRRASFAREAERQARRNNATADRELEQVAVWPTSGDLVAATRDGSVQVLPDVVVPLPRMRRYVQAVRPVREATSA